MALARTHLSTLAALALAGPAAAQYGWQIDVASPVLGPSSSSLPQTTEVTVKAFFDSSQAYAFAGGYFDLVASEPGSWHGNSLLSPFDAVGSSDGTLSTTGAIGVSPEQFHSGGGSGTAGDPSNPAAVWKIRYTVTDFTPRTISLATASDSGFVNDFRVYESATSTSTRQILLSQLAEGAGEISIIPAPSAPAALALGGLALATRRRRN